MDVYMSMEIKYEWTGFLIISDWTMYYGIFLLS